MTPGNPGPARCYRRENADKLSEIAGNAKPSMKQRKDTALRWLRFSLGALLIVPTLLLAYGAANAFQATFRLADERIDHALAISAEQALRSFRTIDVTLDS